MSDLSNVIFYESEKIGKGLPFAIVNHNLLRQSGDLLVPSLRDFHVIFWIIKGRGKYYVDFQEFDFEENTVILLSKDQLHYMEDFPDDIEMQSIVFNPSFLYRSQYDLHHLFNFYSGCHMSGIQILKLNQSDTDFLKLASKNLFEIFNNWSGKRQEEGFYHWLSLTIMRCESIKTKDIEPPFGSIGEGSDTVMEFNDLLEKHFRTEYKVEFYSDQLNITVKTLSRLIKDRFKVSTKALIDERRVLELKRQLKGTTKAVKTIAYEMGFDEPTNMVKYFKKHTGLTPNGFKESKSLVS